MRKAGQVFLHFVIAIALTAGIGSLPQPGFQLLARAINARGGTLFAASAVALLHGMPAGAVIAYLIEVLLAYPDLAVAAHHAIPVVAGCLLGAAIRSVRPEEPTP